MVAHCSIFGIRGNAQEAAAEQHPPVGVLRMRFVRRGVCLRRRILREKAYVRMWLVPGSGILVADSAELHCDSYCN